MSFQRKIWKHGDIIDIANLNRIERGISNTEAAAGIDVVLGTQTATTASWTGVTSLSSIEDGTTIVYWLPYTSASNATLNLTLSDGTLTGAKNVYINGSARAGTQIAAGNIMVLTYRVGAAINGSGSYTGWWIQRGQDTTTNYYDRINYKASVQSSMAISAGRIGVFNADGKLMLLSTASFDVSKPILYVGTAYSANGTQTNNYISYGTAFSLANTISGFSGTAGELVFIKGNLAGTMFQPATGVVTTTVPTAPDGYTYLLLGFMSTTTNMVLPPEHPMFRFHGGSFKTLSQIAAEGYGSGRNLYRYSKRIKADDIYYSSTTGTISQDEDGFDVVTIVPDGQHWLSASFYLPDIPVTAIQGNDICCSFYLKADELTTVGQKIVVNFASFKADNTRLSYRMHYFDGNTLNMLNMLSAPQDNEWVRVWFTTNVNQYTDTSSETPAKYGLQVFLNNTNTTCTANIKQVKIEFGTHPTDWTPAPEDVAGQDTYSADEQCTGETWLDGNYIYKKTIYQQISSANSFYDLPYPTGAVRFVNLTGVLYASNGFTRPMNWVYGTNPNLYSACIYTSPNTVACAASETGLAVMTIYYTKHTGIMILAQPQDATVMALNQSTQFSLVANGDSVTYQWQYSLTNGTTWVNSSGTGATTNTCTVKSASNNINGACLWRCKLSDSNSNTYYSKPVKIIM